MQSLLLLEGIAVGAGLDLLLLVVGTVLLAVKLTSRDQRPEMSEVACRAAESARQTVDGAAAGWSNPGDPERAGAVVVSDGKACLNDDRGRRDGLPGARSSPLP